MLPGQTLSDLKIYIYKDGAKVQEALNSGLASWTAGHASPDLGVVLVSIAPGIDQQLEMDRQIPHEIMHVLLYAMVKENYTRIPMWLNEGLASQAEAYPNQDYQRALTKAAQSKSLIPISALCQEFPQDASSAFLAYAQSSSFVKYLQEKYSTKGLVALVQAYQNGYGCEEGIQSALGIGLEQADHRWQQESLGVDTGTLILQNMMPYLILIILLLAIPLVVIGIAARKPSI